MQNSFSLGLLHGALYGITPLTPWFIGLKRYVFEGQAKGLLTFAGLFLGQVGLLLVAFLVGQNFFGFGTTLNQYLCFAVCLQS